MAGINIFSEVRVVLVEPKVSIRKEFLSVLEELGCREIVETGNLKDAEEAFEEGSVDLLIGEASLPEGKLTNLINKVRHGKMGDNPFIIAMIMVNDSDQQTIREVIDCGADDILIKPTTPENLRQRLTLFARGRKKFVVTTDYVGPDRRTGHRPGTMEIPQIKVPNPLQIRVAGRSGSGFMARAIASSVKQVNEQKIERYAYSMNWMISRINFIKKTKKEVEGVDINKEMVRLHEIAADCRSRLTGTCYQPVAEMFLTLDHMTAAQLKLDAPTEGKDFVLITKLVKVIKRQCDSLMGRTAPETAEMGGEAAKGGDEDKPKADADSGGTKIGSGRPETRLAAQSMEQKLST